MLGQQTFSACVSEFLIERQSRGRTTRTVKLYQSELQYFSNWLDQKGYDTFIESLTPSILRLWFADLATHRNKGGVHSNYRILKALLNWYDFEYEPTWKNPIRKVKIEPSRIPPLEEIPLSDVQKLLNVCGSGYNELRDKSILICLVDTGCRATELLSLNVADVDLATGSVNVLHGKGNKARIVWLGKNGIKSLKEYLKTRPDAKPTEPLFLNDEQKRMKYFGLRNLLSRLCHRANIRVFGPHCFRRCFGLTLYRKTHDVFLVSKLLGHSQINVTLRYLNIGNSDLKESHSLASPADLLN